MNLKANIHTHPHISVWSHVELPSWHQVWATSCTHTNTKPQPINTTQTAILSGFSM